MKYFYNEKKESKRANILRVKEDNKRELTTQLNVIEKAIKTLEDLKKLAENSYKKSESNWYTLTGLEMIKQGINGDLMMLNKRQNTITHDLRTP